MAETVIASVGSHIMRVQHEGIVTHDAEAAKDFYVRVLGLQVLPRPALTSKGYWLGNPGRYPQIHIIQSDLATQGADAAISPRVRHTCFEVADYEAMKATLRREKITFIENEQPGGRVQLLCNDPDGNTLEFQPSSVDA
jgi:catechol 2,3-dioxygenase-like lactoylglutathione lyase family enzyme